MSDVNAFRPWLLNQVPLIPIGTAIEGLFSHSANRAFRKHMGSQQQARQPHQQPDAVKLGQYRVALMRPPVEWRRSLCMDRDKLLR
jgi:hypothetical protein